MAYTARDALKFAYPLLSQHGATRAIWGNSFFYSLNTAINFIYSYNGYIRSRQHVKDAFVITGKKHMKLITRWPVATVDKFFLSQWKDVDGTIRPCDCADDLPDDTYTCPCEIPCNWPECQPIKMRRVLPQNVLCENEYQVSWSEIKWMWGLDWRIIKVNLADVTNVNSLFVTYYRGPKHITGRDDIVPIPDSFMHILWYIIAAHTVPLYGIMMAQQDLNYRSIARKELDFMKMADNVFPDSTRFDPSYPFAEKAQPNPVGMWQYVLP